MVKLQRVERQAAPVALGQLCARSTRMHLADIAAAAAPQVEDIMALGRQLARGAKGAPHLLELVPKRNPGAVWQEVHGDPEHGGAKQGLVHICNGQSWILDAIQFAIFQAADGRRSLGEIIEMLGEAVCSDRAAAVIQVAEILGPEGSDQPLFRMQRSK